MRRWVSGLLVACLVLLLASTASALTPIGPSVPLPSPIKALAPVLVAFSPTPTRLTDISLGSYDLDHDTKQDLSINPFGLTGLNGTTIQLLNPPVASLDAVKAVPVTGYAETLLTQLERVYVAKLTNGGYARFILFGGEKATLLFSAGKPTSSELRLSGERGQVVLEWDALPDAELGYEVFRYEWVEKNGMYEFEPLTDFPIDGLSFVDNSAKNRAYAYQVMARRADGSKGERTTAAAVRFDPVAHTLRIPLNGEPSLDGLEIKTDAPAELRDGRLMVPATVLKHVGIRVTYESATGRITLERRTELESLSVVMTLGTDQFTARGESLRTVVGPYLSGSTPMVPLRILWPYLGFDLDFDPVERAATVGWSD